MIHIRTEDEINIIRENALMVTATLTEVAAFLKAGISAQGTKSPEPKIWVIFDNIMASLNFKKQD